MLLKPITISVALVCLSMTAANANANANASASAQPLPATEQVPAAQVVVTATRGAKALDKIPGAIAVISQQELSSQYLIADDPSQALATFIPGYAPSRQKMTSTGESLRGR